MNDSLVRQMRVLVLGEGAASGPWTQWFDEHARVARVRSLDEALQALSDQSFDLVVSSAEDFSFLPESMLAEQAGYTPIGADQGVWVVGADGATAWSNAYAERLPASLRQRIFQSCMEVLTDETCTAPLRCDLDTEDGKTFEVAITPLADPGGCGAAAAAVIRDATQARRFKRQLDAIDKAGRELLRLDADQIARLDMQERLSLLEQKIIRYTHDLLHFDNFTVFAIDRKTNKLELVLASGMPSEVKAIDLFAYAEGNGISGYVAATGHSYICPDVTQDPRYIRGLSNARSSLTVPLHVNDQIVGVFNVESVRVNGFTEEDRQFAQLFGRNIAIALHVLELLVSERHTTTGRMGKDIMAEVTGPLNDVLTELETLVEDYLGIDDLRHRLRKLSEHVVAVRDTLKQATSPGLGLLTPRTPRATRIDPLLKDKRVLIVDDEDMIRETVRDVLAGYGCRVDIAADGDEALGLIARHAYDLVLSDIKLPTKNGYEIFAATKAANPKTPVMLMTGFGYDPNHAIVRANREGLTAVLFKPFKVDQLLGEIRTAIRSNPAS